LGIKGWKISEKNEKSKEVDKGISPEEKGIKAKSKGEVGGGVIKSCQDGVEEHNH